MGIAIHFTNSLDFFAFSNFPFAYFLVYFLYISVISHFYPITLLSHSPSTPPFSSYCNPPTHSFHILSNRLKHPFYPTPHFLFIQNLVTFFLFSSFSYFSISSQFTLYHPLCEHIFFTFFSYFYWLSSIPMLSLYHQKVECQSW